MNKTTYSMRNALWISWRFLRARENEPSFGIATTISIVGLAIGVAALSITLAILTGFDREYQKSILGLSAHAVVLSVDQIISLDTQGIPLEKDLERNPAVKAVEPFILREGMLTSAGRMAGVLVKGVDPQGLQAMADLESMLEPKGSVVEALAETRDQPAKVDLGEAVAQTLGVQVHDVIQLMILNEYGKPQVYPLRIQTLFHSGMYEYDSRFVFMNLGVSQEVFSMPDKVTGYEVNILEPQNIEHYSPLLRTVVHAPLYLLEWKELNANLFAALKLEKVLFFLLILPLIVVGALTVIAALIMFMMEREKGIAVLRAMGMEKKMISLIFLGQGSVIAALGIALGMGLGTSINLFLKHFPLIRLSPQIYFIDHLPISMDLADSALVVFTSALLCLIAVFIPCFKASRMNPSEVIRAG